MEQENYGGPSLSPPSRSSRKMQTKARRSSSASSAVSLHYWHLLLCLCWISSVSSRCSTAFVNAPCSSTSSRRRGVCTSPTSPTLFSCSGTCPNKVKALQLQQQDDDAMNPGGGSTAQKLSRPERKALERAQKQQKQQPPQNGKKKWAQKTPQTYNLHSQAISNLSSETSTADHVLRAIKRAQNLHDVEDLQTIAQFLFAQDDPVDTTATTTATNNNNDDKNREHPHSFAFGYRGSLWSRLAVAALHMNAHAIASTAIVQRRTEYRNSMLPQESAAILRGLLRCQNSTDAWALLQDELSLPLSVSACMCFVCLSVWDTIPHPFLCRNIITCVFRAPA